MTVQTVKNSSINLLAPTILVVFGATGDLARRKIFPALLSLLEKKLLPSNFRVVAFGRRPFDDTAFRNFIHDALVPISSGSPNSIAKLLSKVSYHRGLFDDGKSYQRLGVKLGDIDEFEFKRCSNKLFYLAVPPEHYETITTGLARSGLTIPCSDGSGWTRVLVEKPFGRDHRSARKLDRLLGKLFREEQIFRIDHYLAKETIQNILTFRFLNGMFEPLWNRKHIERVEINLFESNRVGARGGFYDGIGALRDVGQNHLLTMLAVIAVERPVEFRGEPLRQTRAAAIKKLRPLPVSEINRFVRRGQYEGYEREPGVASNSETETFFRIKASINNNRWRGVLFILTSGKALPESKAEIRVWFKGGDDKFSKPNLLVFRIQPDEGITIGVYVRQPGMLGGVTLEKLSFSYVERGTFDAASAYERVFLDCLCGDQTLFMSTEEIEASWKFITPILEHWRKVPLIKYRPGSGEILRETAFG